MTTNSKVFPTAVYEPALPKFRHSDILGRMWRVAHDLPEDGKLALFDVAESQLVILNALGAAFWNRLDGVSSLGEIALELSEEVEGAPEMAGVVDECVPFLNDLLRRGAISRR